MHKPIFLIGMPGSGKSTVGRKLATALATSFLDLDEYIQQRHGQSVSQIFGSRGEDYFRRIESEALREVTEGAGHAGVIVATGGGTPCFNQNLAYMQQHGILVYLQAPAETIAERLQMPGWNQRPLLAGKEPAEIKTFVFETLNVRSEFYEQAHIIYQNINRDITGLTRAIMSQMEAASG